MSLVCSWFSIPTAVYALYCSNQVDKHFQAGRTALAEKYSDNASSMNSYTILIKLGTDGLFFSGIN